MVRTDLTAARLRELLSYDKTTGLFTRLVSRPNSPVGSIAGTINNNGYVLICIGGVKYRAHRLAWLWVKGVWPEGEIDHWNTKRADNRWRNLRDVPMLHNQQNRRRALKRNRTGLLGVSERGDGFAANIHFAGRDLYLGLYQTPEEAHAAYVAEKRRLHAGCTL